MPAQFYSRSIVRFASLLLMVLAAAAIAHAQDIELKITVTGPWDYVEDPDDSTRVVLVAPQADHHLPPNIDFAGGSSSLSLGRYSLDIANRKAPPCKVSSPPDGKVAVLFHLPQKPTADQIRQVIKNPGLRYAISLPKPCYHSTQESSYSIISPSAITIDAKQAEGKAYTTLMVLHYFVTADAGGTLTSTPDKGNSSAAPVKFDTVTKTIDIKINMDHGLDSNDECDSTSADSFAKEVS